ncbi:hypothetical protein [Blastomonas sp. AAP25]|uniref:hypothetical protein n=1 Tax=Blastomonas sp. AAP25 TaxID=1523416 RepID=UPI000A58D83D|nr:hypothetical protein [Blastomonas sp. AAP25]
MSMFGLMTRRAHDVAMAGQGVAFDTARSALRGEIQELDKALKEAERKARELDGLASKFQTRAKRLELDNVALVAEIDRLRPIAEKAEARKAQALANLKQNRRAA